MQCLMEALSQVQDPIDISSDEEMGEAPPLQIATAAQPTRHSTRSTRHRTTTERFEACCSTSSAKFAAIAICLALLSQLCQQRHSCHMSSNQALLLQGLKALFPPEGGKDSVQIVASDLSRLDPEEFLNDTIIDYFMK